MKRKAAVCALALILSMALPSSAFAANEPLLPAAATPEVCYPSAVTRSDDGKEIRKFYDLDPEDDPAGIPRSDFEQEDFHYTLIDLLKQELPENESRVHTETVTVESENKDMESVLSLLPQERDFVTDDGFSGILTLRLDSVRIEETGHASGASSVSTTRSYPNLQGQDTQYIPKTVEDNGKTLTLQRIDWLTDNTATVDGYALGDRFTAVATYTGTSYYSYVTGYTVTAEYTGTVSRIALNKTRYVAVFEGKSLKPAEPEPEIAPTSTEPASFNWLFVLIPIGTLAAAGAGVGIALLVKKHREESEDDE